MDDGLSGHASRRCSLLVVMSPHQNILKMSWTRRWNKRSQTWLSQFVGLFLHVTLDVICQITIFGKSFWGLVASISFYTSAVHSYVKELSLYVRLHTLIIVDIVNGLVLCKIHFNTKSFTIPWSRCYFSNISKWGRGCPIWGEQKKNVW